MDLEPRSLPLGLTRGLSRRCPNCGAGRLFSGYLTIEDRCAACGHDNGQYPADDAPPYFTIFLVGHLVVAPLLALAMIWRASTLLLLAALVPLVGAVTLAMLPYVKGAVIGAQWALRTPTKSER
jgi:uncharacterized protein (DUF983 family)